MGKPQSCDYSSILLLAKGTCSCLRHPVTETDWDTPTPSSLVHAYLVLLLTSIRHQALLTLSLHLKPPWNIWRWSWGRYLGQIDANPIWGFRLYSECSSHSRPTLQHQREFGESWTLTFKPKVQRFKYTSNVSCSLRLTFESGCSEKIELLQEKVLPTQFGSFLKKNTKPSSFPGCYYLITTWTRCDTTFL